jgi:hypothetical protein
MNSRKSNGKRPYFTTDTYILVAPKGAITNEVMNQINRQKLDLPENALLLSLYNKNIVTPDYLKSIWGQYKIGTSDELYYGMLLKFWGHHT